MKNLSNSEDSYYEIDDAVNINVIFRILLRSKNLLITTTFFLTSLIIASSYLIKPVYRGYLKMVTGDDKSVGLLNAPSFLVK